ncbi:MAG TPA: DUF192 domain-containing protein [Candidatus Paceibacterota bacterium]|nr:DUF192 domain-containing protein [Candidatus Paceibacterota bacterium]
MSETNRKHNKNALVLLAVVIIAAVGFEVWYNLPQASAPAPAATQRPVVMIDGQTISVELEETPAQQELGLGGRAGLADHAGMLFIFPSNAQHMFWMKDMEFSIDMIWLSQDGTVIYIQPHVSPDTYPEAFGPDAPSRYVLEVPANFAATYGIKVGDTATLP